ncbi:4-hydroxy-2-oxo-heptane-1,7-dioate aldolase [Candidatus Bathyarchaeota archaeon]|nr:4-hydroxy-2-oxo-heptane-1,7-dioate aldolase [Candidatus Bathyarchaeota archaeon]
MKNLLKEKLARGESAVGTFIEMGHPDITEILSHAGFDWLLIDGEHSPLGFETMERMLQGMAGTDCTPIIRPQWNDPVIIKRVLDLGAHGILVPWVNTKKEAEAAVSACMYPPEGIRGWGPRRAARWDPDYRETANTEMLVSVQVETQKSLNNLDEIMGVEGVDACYVGPWDLSNNLGFSVPPNYDNKRFTGALDHVLKVSEDHGKPAGLWCNMDIVSWAVEKGFRFNTVSNADSFLMYGAKEALKRAGK